MKIANISDTPMIIINFELVQHFGLVFLLLTVNLSFPVESKLTEIMYWLTLERRVSNKRPYLRKQTSSFQVQVCLSMYGLSVDTNW